MQIQFPKLWLLITSLTNKSVPLQCLETAKSLIGSCRRVGETIFSNYWQNPQITAAVYCFQKQPPEMFCKKRCSLKVCEFHRKTPVLELCWKIWACNLIKKKLQYGCFPLKFAKFLRTPILNNICQRLLLYFHYNSHHHYHHYHFHYHCKMHLYHLRILLLIPLHCNMIPCLFQLNFVSFFRHIFFSSVISSFSFNMSSKRTQNSIMTSRQIQLFSLQLYLYIWLFALLYLHLLAYTYLHLIIHTYVLFILLCELEKIVKIWGIQKLQRNFLG